MTNNGHDNLIISVDNRDIFTITASNDILLRPVSKEAAKKWIRSAMNDEAKL